MPRERHTPWYTCWSADARHLRQQIDLSHRREHEDATLVRSMAFVLRQQRRHVSIDWLRK